MQGRLLLCVTILQITINACSSDPTGENGEASHNIGKKWCTDAYRFVWQFCKQRVLFTLQEKLGAIPERSDARMLTALCDTQWASRQNNSPYHVSQRTGAKCTTAATTLPPWNSRDVTQRSESRLSKYTRALSSQRVEQSGCGAYLRTARLYTRPNDLKQRQSGRLRRRERAKRVVVSARRWRAK